MWGGTWGISDNGDKAIKKKLEKKGRYGVDRWEKKTV